MCLVAVVSTVGFVGTPTAWAQSAEPQGQDEPKQLAQERDKLRAELATTRAELKAIRDELAAMRDAQKQQLQQRREAKDLAAQKQRVARELAVQKQRATEVLESQLKAQRANKAAAARQAAEQEALFKAKLAEQRLQTAQALQANESFLSSSLSGKGPKKSKPRNNPLAGNAVLSTAPMDLIRLATTYADAVAERDLLVAEFETKDRLAQQKAVSSHEVRLIEIRLKAADRKLNFLREIAKAALSSAAMRERSVKSQLEHTKSMFAKGYVTAAEIARAEEGLISNEANMRILKLILNMK